MEDEIKKKILDSGKITEEELNKKIVQKMQALSGLISEDGAAHIIAGELGLNTEEDNVQEGSNVNISDLTANMRSVFILGKVVQKYELHYFGEDKSGKVGSLLLGDETGFTRLTFWNDKCDFFEKISDGDILEVQNAYTKENNNRIEVHMGNSSNCIINPEGKEIKVKERPQYSNEVKKIKEITDDDEYVNLKATIVQVYDPRFFEVCPECNKRMQIADGGKFKCSEHGQKEPSYNYVLNIFLDDGSDNIRATLWKEQIQALLDMDDLEVVKLKEDSNKLEEIKNDLLGKIIETRGKIKKNEAFNQREIVLYKIDLEPSPEPERSVEPKKTKEDPKKAPTKTEDVSEEMIGNDEEELLDIEDLDE